MISNFILWSGASSIDIGSDTNFQFYITEGLARDGTISFESVSYPERYLRHSECDIWLNMGSGSIFRESASFYQRPGLSGVGGVSFESYDKPGHYLRVSESRVTLDPVDCCDNFNQGATFYSFEVETVEEVFSYDDVFITTMDADLRLSVTQEILYSEMVTNANE
mmetsp:Transcript_13491/g.13226  ORF Transcript_13491/g.13226 Transcript_13491/m.13226 type:complete len:165 (+) Transcript_13491:2805-3299(+)